MNARDLTSRLIETAYAEGAEMTVARNRAAVIVGWLQSSRAEDSGPNAPSRATVLRRRSVLRAAGIAPAETAAELAAVAEALGIESSDRSRLARLAWHLRTRRGPYTYAQVEARSASLIAEVQDLLERGRVA